MSVEDNKAIARRIFEVFNTGNMALADAVIAADVVDHQPPPGIEQGLAGFKQLIGMLRAGFPDLQVTIEDVIAEGDKVTVRSIIHGTHQGDFMGIAPTGKPVKFQAIDVLRLAGGKAVEHWGNQDDLGMLQQLGVIPTLGQ
jgi:predicted ester cyclase